MRSLIKKFETKKYLLALLAVSFLGMFNSLYLTYLHFSSEANSFCNFGERFNCEVVNSSSYSEMFGVPIAFLGFTMFLVLGLMTIYASENTSKRKITVQIISVMLFFGFIYSIYLVYIQKFVLKTYCTFCIVLDILILLALILSIIALGSIKIDHEAKNEKEYRDSVNISEDVS